MVRIILNEEELTAPVDDSVTLQELMDNLKKGHLPPNHFINKITIGDQEFTLDNISEHASLSLREIDSVRVFTEDLIELNKKILYEQKGHIEQLLKDNLDQLVEDFADISDKYRLGEEIKASDKFSNSIDRLLAFIEYISSVQATYNVDFSQIDISGVSLSQLLDDLKNDLEQMLSAQQDQDWVLLSDLLEYELASKLEDWKQVIPVLQKQILSP